MTSPPAAWTLTSLHEGARARMRDYLQLAKARLSLMVVLSGVVGYWLASSALDRPGLLWFTLGTFLIVAGANAFNQVLERETDRRMARTSRRPLPSGRLGLGEASVVATALTLSGLFTLLTKANVTSATLAAIAFFIYVFVYTPMKTRTTWSTLPGAISGAIPPLMGWSAVRPELSPLAWCLFGVLFLWQFPHTWAIAATYRDDYAKAGYTALPADPGGRLISFQTIVVTVLLVGASVVPVFLQATGAIYLAGALALGAALLAAAVRFHDGTSKRMAAQLLAATLFYLPALLALLAIDQRVS